jgi:hypothetical protein
MQYACHYFVRCRHTIVRARRSRSRVHACVLEKKKNLGLLSRAAEFAKHILVARNMPDEGGVGWPFLLLAEFVKHILVHTIPARLSSDFLDTDGRGSLNLPQGHPSLGAV